MFPRQNLAGMYAILGDVITHVAQGSGIETGDLRGMYAMPGETLFDGDVVVDMPAVRYPLAAWPDVQRGDTLRIAMASGIVTRVVREGPQRIGDGEEAVVKLVSA